MQIEHELYIERILSTFEFESVQKVMKFLDWKWVFSKDDESGIPSIRELKETARRLLVDCANDPQDNSEHATGGFTAMKDHKHWFRLSFVLESWEEPGDEELGVLCENATQVEEEKSQKDFSSPLAGLQP